MAEPAPFDTHDQLSPEELRQRLRSLETIIARLPVPIAIAHDPECRFISANRALAALLQVPPTANVSLTPLTGKPLYRIQQNGQDMPPSELPMQYAIAHRMGVSNEIEILRADGSVVYVQNDVEPLYDTHGQIYGCVSVAVDVSDRKRAEVAFRDADRRKDEFLATLSHELRNPLAPIRSAVEVMRLAHDDPKLIERARATIERQLLQLVRITDDLLDVSRITQDKVQLKVERVDVRTILQSAVEATRPLIDAQGHALIIDAPPEPVWADADFTRLAQVFSNLLNNAAKYTERGGRIHLTVTAEGGTATIAVTDTGVGIPSAMLPRIFDMFRQLQEFRDRTHGGLGIGLTLAKRLVELHGGTIDAHSDGPGRGSSFVVRIPAVKAAADIVSRAEHDITAAAHAGCRVLVAEDNPDAAEMMRIVLQMNGSDVRVAMDGEEAITIAEAFDPQIAFLDIGMPRVDGYEAARRIRHVLGERVVLVALTGWGQDEDKRRSHEAGFDHHLTKPPEPEVLERMIADCVVRRAG
jgi:signal transduction histidine kinase/ActR/RegA family two-component response regulator